jgi:hypothetical protein
MENHHGTAQANAEAMHRNAYIFPGPPDETPEPLAHGKGAVPLFSWEAYPMKQLFHALASDMMSIHSVTHSWFVKQFMNISFTNPHICSKLPSDAPQVTCLPVRSNKAYKLSLNIPSHHNTEWLLHVSRMGDQFTTASGAKGCSFTHTEVHTYTGAQIEVSSLKVLGLY